MNDARSARRIDTWLLPIAATLLLFAGCDLSTADSSSGGLLTRSTAGNEGEMTAIVGGTFELDPDRGCVLLDGKPVVWPAGTTVSTSLRSFICPAISPHARAT